MDLRQINEDITVSPQIDCEDIAAIAEAGYRAILCNRPDGEEAGQCDYAPLEEAAKEAGLEVHFVPIIPGQISREDVEAFQQALDELPKPLLAYCRTGTRCAKMWSVTQFGQIPAEDILQATSKAGYDMTGLLMQLQQQSR